MAILIRMYFILNSYPQRAVMDSVCLARCVPRRLDFIIGRRRAVLKARAVCAFSFARSDTAIHVVCGRVHYFARPGGLVTVDVGAAERELRTARDAPREARRFALGGHSAKTGWADGHN